MDNYIDKWQALLDEYDAKLDRLDAEARLRHTDWREHVDAEFQAIGDWTEATWNEFVANIEQRWQSFVIDNQGDEDKQD